MTFTRLWWGFTEKPGLSFAPLISTFCSKLPCFILGILLIHLSLAPKIAWDGVAVAG